MSNAFTLRAILRDCQDGKIGRRGVWRLLQIDTSDNIHEAAHQSDALIRQDIVPEDVEHCRSAPRVRAVATKNPFDGAPMGGGEGEKSGAVSVRVGVLPWECP